jgi:hypothetical protein
MSTEATTIQQPRREEECRRCTVRVCDEVARLLALSAVLDMGAVRKWAREGEGTKLTRKHDADGALYLALMRIDTPDDLPSERGYVRWERAGRLDRRSAERCARRECDQKVGAARGGDETHPLVVPSTWQRSLEMMTWQRPSTPPRLWNSSGRAVSTWRRRGYSQNVPDVCCCPLHSHSCSRACCRRGRRAWMAVGEADNADETCG